MYKLATVLRKCTCLYETFHMYSVNESNYCIAKLLILNIKHCWRVNKQAYNLNCKFLFSHFSCTKTLT